VVWWVAIVLTIWVVTGIVAIPFAGVVRREAERRGLSRSRATWVLAFMFAFGPLLIVVLGVPLKRRGTD